MVELAFGAVRDNVEQGFEVGIEAVFVGEVAGVGDDAGGRGGGVGGLEAEGGVGEARGVGAGEDDGAGVFEAGFCDGEADAGCAAED